MSVKTKDIQDAKRPAKYLSLDEFNRSVRKVPEQIEILEKESEFFIEVDGEIYYIPKNARVIVRSAAVVQKVFH